MIYRDLTPDEQHALEVAILHQPPTDTLDRLYDLAATNQLRILVDYDAELAQQWAEDQDPTP